MTTKNAKILNLKYICEDCDYFTSNKSDFLRHLSTPKHQKMLNTTKKTQKNARPLCEEVDKKKFECLCGKIYKHHSSLYNHKKKCILIKTEDVKEEKNKNFIINKETDVLKNMIGTLIEENRKMQKENKEMRKEISNMMPKIGNTNYTFNNKVNIQVFLQENCKDDLNLDEFMNTLKLEVNDLDETRKNGYIIGLTNIFLRELSQLDLHQRPIHCSDLKRETLYIKNNNIWKKDGNEKQIMKDAITSITKKQIDKISEWETVYNKNFNKEENYTKNYLQLIKNITDEGNDENRERSNNKIIKNIAKEVLISDK